MITRRTALGSTLGGLTALAALSSQSHAEKPAAAKHCFTVLYPWQADAKFDFGYYVDKHLPLFRKLYGASVGKMEVRKGLRKGDGSEPAFIASVTIEILSMEGFEAAGKQHLPAVRADVPNYTNIRPVTQIEESTWI
jgi:uncharacterized protein (TIGR02118 family)